MIPGIVIALSSQCMRALINPPSRGMTSVRWVVTAHTVAMLSIVTVNTAMSLNIQSISYIDNREFPGANGVPNPGPLGYQSFIYSKPISIAPYTMFFLNNWLVDGLQVSFTSNSGAQMGNVGCSSSSTVAILFTPWTAGQLPSPAWCT